MKFSLKEKTLILGTLFHDIGKFEQRCRDYKGKSHPSLGAEFINSLQDSFLNILDNSTDAFNEFVEIVNEHHNRDNGNSLVSICALSDHVSASERVDLEKKEEPSETWKHKFLSSIFSKVNILSEAKTPLRYFQHRLLDKTDYKILIPDFESTDDAHISKVKYPANIWSQFENDVKAVLGFYKTDEDFNSLVNLLLMVFEKYMWCIPDFTGSEQTDISLYNHLKDITALSHAIYLTREDSVDKQNSNLNLVIGDLPGIQSYIFNVINKKPAKILRGRSIFVQVITRIFANIFLNNFGLSEANLIMLAGGKFYIIAPSNNSFNDNYQKAVAEIEQILIENYDYQLKFAAGYEKFDAVDLRDRKRTFGDIIEKASFNLLNGRHQIFKNDLIKDFDEQKFVLKKDYIKESDSEKIKCAVTDIPLELSNRRPLNINQENDKIFVSKQVETEFNIGSNITHESVVVSYEITKSNELRIKSPKRLTKYNSVSDDYKIIINPKLDELLEKDNKAELLRNAQFIEVANYASLDLEWDKENKPEDNPVMDFEEMEENAVGAKFLTLIKADIDNLGLIMAYGLENDERDYSSISRTTTLSNQLKYFFSFFLNGYLRKDWDYQNRENREYKKEDQLVYTIFAGGDDLMLITPQSSSLQLVNEINKKFNEFICGNEEIHISYSLTNFKHNTPIRLVAEISEENQREAKKLNDKETSAEKIVENSNYFLSSNNKASTYLFKSKIKNQEKINELLTYKEKLVGWVQDENNKVTKGIIRHLLELTEIMLDFENNGKTEKLLYHPKLTYIVNRLLKDKNGNYSSEEIEDFFAKVLRINKDNTNSGIKDVLFPLLNEVIYATRNSKGE
jgi:CRISPR-associated protein Csm1